MNAPEYRQYIPEALSKTVWADIAILMVSAKVNQFDPALHNGELKEHVLLCMGNIIVAVNYMNQVGLSIESFDSTKKELKFFLKSSTFSEPLVYFISCSSEQTENI